MQRQQLELTVVQLADGNPYYALKEKFYHTLPAICAVLREEVCRTIDIDASTPPYECLAYLSGRAARLTLPDGKRLNTSLPIGEPPEIGLEACDVLSHWIDDPLGASNGYFAPDNYMLPWINTFERIAIPISATHVLIFRPHAPRAVIEIGVPSWEAHDAMMVLRRRIAGANNEPETMSMVYKPHGNKPDIYASCFTLKTFGEVNKVPIPHRAFPPKTTHVFSLHFGSRAYFAPMTKTQRTLAKDVFSDAPLKFVREHCFCFTAAYLTDNLFQ